MTPLIVTQNELTDRIQRDRSALKAREARRTACAENVAQSIGPIVPGVDCCGFCKGCWSVVDALEYMLATTGPANVGIATWAIGGADTTFALRLLGSGSIQSLRFVTDDSFVRRQPEYTAALVERFGIKSIRLVRLHAKICLVRNADWNLVFRGSQNFNKNLRVEWWELSDDRPLADLVGDFFDELFRSPAVDPFAATSADHGAAFAAALSGNEFNNDGAAADDRQFFSDAPFGRDLRRCGLSYTGGANRE